MFGLNDVIVPPLIRPGYDDDSVKMNLKENVHRYIAGGTSQKPLLNRNRMKRKS